MNEIHIWDLSDADVQLLIAAVRAAGGALDDYCSVCGRWGHDEDCPIRLALEALAVKPSEVEHG
jgi:hypothetical protein